MPDRSPTQPDPAVSELMAASETWPAEMAALRPLLLERGLGEQVKWRKPCYDLDGANLAIMQEMKGFLALMFFKGALLDDPDSLLRSQGANSRSAKRLEFTSVAEIEAATQAIGDLIDRAIAVEEAGLEIPPAPELELVAELQDRLDADPALRAAFDQLTPGRQREYHLQISSAKKAETRVARVDKYVPKILAGKGFRDR